MTTGRNDGDRAPRVPDAAAERLLARAAELDVEHGAGTPVEQLRRVALEAGIAPAAFDAALREAAAGSAPPVHERRAPGWVRLVMFGVPDRRAAMGFYALFAAALCALPLLALTDLLETPLTIAGSLFLLFAAWSTSRAVRWLDEHGWEQLP